jgi:hypothetical protein
MVSDPVRMIEFGVLFAFDVGAESPHPIDRNAVLNGELSTVF